MSLSDLPKIDLHLHLEGAAPPALLRDIARQNHLDLSGLFDAAGQYRFAGAEGLQRAYQAACTAFRGPKDYHRLTLAALEQAAQDGVIYCETLISPDLCGGGDLAAWRDHLAALRDAGAQAEREMGLTPRFVAICQRHLGPEAARQTALCAAETAGDGLVGFGLTGDERIGATKDYRWAFDCAREAGLRLMAVAGERGGHAMIRDTLEQLGVHRIGHGVRAIEDLVLVDALAERGTVLDLCPAANLTLGLYPGWRAHPAGELQRRGVRFTLGSDKPAFFGMGLTQVQDRLHDAFDWDDGVFRDITRSALDAAFCDADTRDRIARKL